MPPDSTRRRTLVPHLLIAALALATAASIASERAWWPIAHYPMFSRVQRRAPSTTVEVYLVHGDRESPLPPEAAYFSRDFDGVGVRTVIGALARRAPQGGHDTPAMRRFLALLLAAAHDRAPPGPDAVRLYRERRAFDAPTDARPRVTERRLLLEVARAP